MTMTLEALLTRHQSGCTLERDFYTAPDVFETDLREVLLKDWFIAGVSCQIGAPGDYFTLNYAGESIIVARGEDGLARAFLNICRHRGSRICTTPTGHAKRLVCPYHAWSYGLDGSLRPPRGAPPGFKAADHGLRTLPCVEAHGLVFVSFWQDAPSLAAELAQLEPYLAPYDMAACRVAAERRYRVTANWKLVAENFFECYHCLPTHPEFCRTRSDLVARPDEKMIANEAATLGAISREIGLTEESIEPIWQRQRPGIPFVGYFRNYMRLSHETMTRTGGCVGPLLGNFKKSDHSETDILFGPNSHIMAYCDHAVVFQFVPISTLETEIVTLWLVRDQAEVDVEALIELWDVTTQQDLTIIETNQKGVLSRFYAPGPYMKPESDTRGLTEWYLSSIAPALPYERAAG